MDNILNNQGKLSRRSKENLKVLFALMSLGGKSDRAISAILGINNTTLSRRRRILEREGYIKEYTSIPDFHKIGLDVVIFTFVSTSDPVKPEQAKYAAEIVQKHPEMLLLLEDQYFGKTNWVGVSLHRNYDGFMALAKEVQNELLSLKQQPKFNIHWMLFRMSKDHPKPFSFKNIEMLFKQNKNLHYQN